MRKLIRQLIREAIEKEKTKVATQSLEDNTGSGGGGGNEGRGDLPLDLSDAPSLIKTTRRGFISLMAKIGAAVGIGAGVGSVISKGSSSLGLTDAELFKRAGFVKKNITYMAPYMDEPFEMGGFVYEKIEEITPGVTVTITINQIEEIDGVGTYSYSIKVNWNPADNLGYIYSNTGDDLEGTALEILDHIRVSGLNNIMDLYIDAIKKKEALAIEAIQNADEIYMGHDIFDLNNKEDDVIYDLYSGGFSEEYEDNDDYEDVDSKDSGEPEIYYWWKYFIHVFGVPKRIWCSENDSMPFYDLVNAGMKVDKYIPGRNLPSVNGIKKGIVWAKTGVFDGKRVVIFQSNEAISYSVFLD